MKTSVADSAASLASELTATQAQRKSEWRSVCCEGERCFCGAPADRKVGEEIPPDDPTASFTVGDIKVRGRHNLTAYVCFEHFAQIMGPAAIRFDKAAASAALAEGTEAAHD